VAALAQGIVLGGPFQGVKIEGRVYSRAWSDWLSPFSLLTGISRVCGYALLGAGWLIVKSDGRLQQRAYRFAGPLAFGLLAAIAAVSAATPFLDGNYYRRWFAWPGVLAAVQMPLLVALTGFLLVARSPGGRSGCRSCGRSAILPDLYRPGNQALARHHPGPGDNLGSSGAPRRADVRADRHHDHSAGSSGLHRLGLLGLSWQDGRRGLSLMNCPSAGQIAWFGIWAASVAALLLHVGPLAAGVGRDRRSDRQQTILDQSAAIPRARECSSGALLGRFTLRLFQELWSKPSRSRGLHRIGSAKLHVARTTPRPVREYSSGHTGDLSKPSKRFSRRRICCPSSGSNKEQL
jgi:Cytochrome bd terminal oxidase subunit II